MADSYKGVGFNEAIVACRALRPQDYDKQRRALWNRLVAQGISVPPTYPGHIVKECEICGIEVQVGPRQQEALAEISNYKVCCLLCAVIPVKGNDPDDVAIINLDNPHQGKDKS